MNNKNVNILIGCEASQTILTEFRIKGFNAYSCDLEDSYGNLPEYHLKMDIFEALSSKKWDLLIAHPPCTYLCTSGIHWNKKNPDRNILTNQALDFVKKLMDSPIKNICIENPISIISSRIRKPDQIIRPYQFGDDSTKATCLWLKNLPKLTPTNIVIPTKHITKNGSTYDKWWFDTCRISNLKERSRVRSKTFPGIAKAIAEQWGDYLING
jgi:hypothetical protein